MSAASLKSLAQSQLLSRGEPSWKDLETIHNVHPCVHMQIAVALKYQLDEERRATQMLRERIEDLAQLISKSSPP